VVFCWCKASVSSVGDLRFRLAILVWAAAKKFGLQRLCPQPGESSFDGWCSKASDAVA
jgi:hypothetical protein